MTVPSSIHGLGWLLDPVGIDEFFESYWGERPLRISRNDVHYFGVFPSLDEVDGLMTATIEDENPKHGRLIRTSSVEGFAERSFTLGPHGRLDINEVYRSYSDRFTVVLNQIELRSASVAAVCRTLEDDLGRRVTANYYLTPPSAQGFAAHYDSHDVIIVQIHGTKTWRVGNVPYADKIGAGVAEEGFAESSQEWVLRAGDAMYLPKGCAHQAVTGVSSSLHVTFGLVELSWNDLNIPSVDRTESAEPAEDLLSFNVLLELDSGRLAARSGQSPAEFEPVRQAFISDFLTRPMVRTGHFASLDAIGVLTPDTLVSRAVPGPMHVRVVDDALEVLYPGGVSIQRRVDADAMAYIASQNGQFRINEILGLSNDDERIRLVKALIRDGVLAA